MSVFHPIEKALPLMEILFIGPVMSNILENMMSKKRIHCDGSYQGQSGPDFF
jgi:hypothetical protein